jgi:hypothetical protein
MRNREALLDKDVGLQTGVSVFLWMISERWVEAIKEEVRESKPSLRQKKRSPVRRA